MKILITGATGFLGARAFRLLSETEHVVALPSALVRGEITDRRAERLTATVAAFAPDVIFHTAAISSTAYTQSHPEESLEANVKLPETLARVAARLGCKLVYCSSDQVYNGCAGDGPFAEDAPPAPKNVYGLHKLEAEERVQKALPNAVGLRLTWMYDLPSYGLPIRPNLLTNLLRAAVSGEPLSLSESDQRGVTYVWQVVANLPKAFALPGGVYNFGSESGGSVADVGRSWCAALGVDPKLIVPRNGAPRSLRMDCTKIKGKGILFDESCIGIDRCMEDYGLKRL